MESKEDFQAHLSAQARFVSKLTDVIGERLEGFGVFFSPADAIPVTVRWLVDSADEAGLSVDEFIEVVDADLSEAADTIVSMLLLEIGEERPGSDPWDFELTVPMPVSVATLMVHMLTMCANLAFASEADRWTQNAIASCGSMSAVIAEQFIRSGYYDGKMEVLMRNGHRMVEGPIVKMPQPALAYLARFFESASYRIEKGMWKLDSLEIVSKEEVADNVRHEAAVLRDLCLRYGRSPGPLKDS